MPEATVLALFAKAPVAGQVKTRLSPPLDPAEAARLYEAMLLDIVDQHAREEGVQLYLWFAPDSAESWFRKQVPAPYTLRAQQGASLADRMRSLFRYHAAQGATRTVLRGTDSPTLPTARVREAVEALAGADLVLCPDRDGGYNLIGLREPVDPLFDLEMSTESVLETTLRCAQGLGMRVALLEPHHDVDVAADLALLAREVSPEIAPRTYRWVTESVWAKRSGGRV